MVYAMYHPAAALRAPDVERQSYDDAAGIPAALLEARRRRAAAEGTATASEPRADAATAGEATPASEAFPAPPPDTDPADPALDAPTFF